MDELKLVQAVPSSNLLDTTVGAVFSFAALRQCQSTAALDDPDYLKSRSLHQCDRLQGPTQDNLSTKRFGGSLADPFLTH